MKKFLALLALSLVGCVGAVKTEAPLSPAAVFAAENAPENIVETTSSTSVKMKKVTTFECRKWVQFDPRKNDYVAISAEQCANFDCKKALVFVTSETSIGVTAHVGDATQFMRLVQPVGLVMNGGSTYSAGGYEFWISPNGKIKRLTIPGGRVSIGVECRE